MHRIHHFQLSIVALAGLLLATAGSPGQQIATQEDPYLLPRMKMVQEQVIREGVRNPRVIQSMRTVPRHLFVAPEFQGRAYLDLIIPIGHNQTLSTPPIVSFMTEMIDPQPTEKVLEIGTGSGYQAAVLSSLVKEVYTIEIVDALSKEATERLKKLGYTNIKTRSGDGYKGWPEEAPFDKIIVTCSPEKVPQPLVDQLKEGGKIIVPLGERYSQAFYLLEKQQGKMVQTRLQPTLFVPMTGLADKERELKASGDSPKLVNGGFEEIAEGMPIGWFYARQLTIETFGAKQGNNYVRISSVEPKRDAHLIQAIGINGQKIRALRMSYWVKHENIVAGTERFEVPAVVMSFFDSNNNEVGEAFMGPYLGSANWKQALGEMRVPPKAALARLRIGLNGATGSISFDDMKIVPIKR